MMNHPLGKRDNTRAAMARSRRTRTSRTIGRSKAAIATIVLALGATVGVAAPPLDAQEAGGQFPWEALPGAASSAVGAGLELSPTDLAFILQQIKISEQHALTTTASDPCSTLIGDGANQIPPGPNSEELPFGVRTVNGICNNLVPGQENFGGTDEPFVRLTTPVYRDAEPVSGFDFNGTDAPNLGQTTTYAAPFTWVEDSGPRTVSNLIVDQTVANPAAAARAENGPVDADGNYNIENTAPDEGLSAPFNDMFTFFGQFFDHGLDLTTKSGEVVYMPLQPDDPLYNPAPGFPNFMLVSRSSDEMAEAINQTSPFVDQNQTYASHPSHQVFLREYELNGVLDPVSTGGLIEGVIDPVAGTRDGMATWTDLKAQAAEMLGIQLTDADVLAVPLLATDLYGKFIPGLNGFPQIVTDSGLVEGDPAANAGAGLLLPANTVRTGHAFLVDIAHHAVPGFTNPAECPGPPTLKTPDADTDAFTDDGICTTYDDEMLGAHFMAGDGRVNENIALTSVHHVFHSEHNRLVGHIQDVLVNQTNATTVAQWQIGPGTWNGEYLFQAAKFATEMQYQHLVFEEFGRKIQPTINVFSGYDSSINPAISVEFSQSVYRFGHSMLNNIVTRYDADGTPNDIDLFDAFLNPPSFMASYPGDPDDAAGAVFRGGTATVGQQIDEFVVEALRSRLVGLPLDLAAINIARGREAGIPPLNEVRRQLYAQTNQDSSLTPYDNWVEFRLELRGDESIVNFLAAYGTHPFIMSHDDGSGAGTLSSRRAAGQIIVDYNPADIPQPAPADVVEFMTSTGAWATASGAATTTGVDAIDLWVGGLAERPEIFGGMLGSTMNRIFEVQMEDLQNGDRFYYLGRLAGTDFLASLEGNSLGELVSRNTTAQNLPADVFSRPTYFFDVGFQGTSGAIVDDPATEYNEALLLLRMPNGSVRYPGAEHVNMVGGDTIGDRIHSGEGDDTVRGNGGNDRLEGDGGNDAIIGGAGDDIITDSFGEDVLKGGPGHDAIRGGPFFDLLQGNAGDDFIVQGNDLSETFGGSGDDVINGGNDSTIIFGGDGDDWIEGGNGADLLQGGNGDPFQNTATGGHDVLIGQGGADDIDSEGGDDILIAGPGTSRFEGMLGYDWITHYTDPQPAVTDLTRNNQLPDGIDTIADRFDLVEAVSGWIHDDIIKGDSEVLDVADIGGHALDADGIARLAGLADILPPGTTVFGAGNILLGGAGSDEFEGRGDDDVIDGDRWLRVQLEAPVPGGGGTLQRVDNINSLAAAVFSGLINPGTIDIVRTIETAPAGSDIDVAKYAGPRADYNVVQLAPSVWRVDHVRGCGDPTGGDNCPDTIDLLGNIMAGIDEGTDRLINIETVQFLDAVVDVSVPAVTGLLRVTTSQDINPLAGVPSQIMVDGFVGDSFGLNFVEVPVGQHEVCFTDVMAFTTPPCQTVTVDETVTTAIDGQFTANGWLRVQTSPALPSTITVEGEPANDWGMWSDVAPGIYEVCWGAVAGWAPPICEEATVTAGATTLIVGTFTADPAALGATNFGLLRVTTSQDVDPLAGVPGKVTVDDGVGTLDLNDHWGLTWVKIPPSTPTVCFSDVEGFTTPACQEVTVTDGSTTVVNGLYIKRGTLRVLTAPNGGQPSTISVDGIARNAFGMWTAFPTGNHEVCFGDVPGLTAPACQTVNVVAGATSTVTGTFL